MNTKESFTRHCGSGELELVAFDGKLAFYTDEHFNSLTTVRRDKKKLTRRDKREAQALIDLLFAKCEVGNA